MGPKLQSQKFVKVRCMSCNQDMWLTETEYQKARATGRTPTHYRSTWRRTTERCGKKGWCHGSA